MVHHSPAMGGQKSSRYLLFLIFLIFLCIPCIAVHAQNNKNKKCVVVLDAGHGGKDPGTHGNGFDEKNIALQIVLNIGKELEKHQDIKVLYTRKTDVFVTLKGRAEKANHA